MNSKLVIFSVFDLIILSSQNPSFFMTSCSSVPRCFACALNFRQKKKKLKKATRQWHGQIFLASNCWKRSREDHLILIRIPAVHGSEISHFGYATWHAQWYQWYPPSDHHPNWCWLLPCVHKSFPAGERGRGRRRRIGVEMIHGMTRRGRHVCLNMVDASKFQSSWGKWMNSQYLAWSAMKFLGYHIFRQSHFHSTSCNMYHLIALIRYSGTKKNTQLPFEIGAESPNRSAKKATRKKAPRPSRPRRVSAQHDGWVWWFHSEVDGDLRASLHEAHEDMLKIWWRCIAA